MIGQKHIQKQIKTAIESNSLARFIILVGDVGSGRKTLAKEIAGWLGANYILVDKGVDAVREVIEQSYMISADVVYVLDGDNMSGAAKSALLKVTEEPPNNVRFILVINSVETMLDTLISRACVYRMDNYTEREIAEFAGSDDVRYQEYCSNKYEVDLLKAYGIDDFMGFVLKVVDNIDEVSSANAFKIEQSIAFSADDDKYDMKIFLQAFNAVCLDRAKQDTEGPNRLQSFNPNRLMYLDWIKITTDTIATMRALPVNKQSLFDNWIFDIRSVYHADS